MTWREGWKAGRWKAPLFLAVASPVLAEVLSGNIPPLLFIPLLPFFLVAYGIPVLLIRDAWIRLRLGVPGLFVLGLAYGFVNEALFAKTVFLDQHVPIDTFDGYAGSGVNWAWSSFIVPWHALHSVLYPIAFAWWLFPSRRAEPWLSKRTSLGLFAVMLLLGTIVHAGFDQQKAVAAGFAKDAVPDLAHGGPGTLASWMLSIALIAGLAAIALRLPRRPPLLDEGLSGRGMTLLGVLVAPLLILMAAASDAKPPTLAVVAIPVVFFALWGFLVGRGGGFTAPAFLRFALGNEMAFVVLAILFDTQRGTSFDTIAGHIALEVVFVMGFLRLRREAHAQASVAEPY